MHPHTAELLDHLRQSRAELRAAWDAVPEALHAVRPGPARWSALEVLHHLALVGGQVAALCRRGLRTAPEGGAGLPPSAAGAVGPALARIDAAALLDRQRRAAAPAAVVPPPDAPLEHAELWARLDCALEELCAAVRAADGRDTSGIRAPHPLIGELDFVQWVAFAGLHERRHAGQLREIVRELGTG